MRRCAATLSRLELALDRASGRLTHRHPPLADSMAYIVTDGPGDLLSASYPGNKLTINPIGDKGWSGRPDRPDRPKRTASGRLGQQNVYARPRAICHGVDSTWNRDPGAQRATSSQDRCWPRHLALREGRFST
jgi:hypothetical protein